MTDITPTTPAFTQAARALQAAVAVALQEGLDKSICGPLDEASAEAQAIIAAIPATVMEIIVRIVQNAKDLSTLAKRPYTIPLLTSEKVLFPPGQSFSAMKRAHRIVFDYCEAAGLKPSLYEMGAFWGDGYRLQIEIKLTQEQIQAASQKCKSTSC
jgi:hypothetical protein